MTSLSVRKVQEMAAAGTMPGAAKLGGVWTLISERFWLGLKSGKRTQLGRGQTYQPTDITLTVAASMTAQISWSRRNSND